MADVSFKVTYLEDNWEEDTEFTLHEASETEVLIAAIEWCRRRRELQESCQEPDGCTHGFTVLVLEVNHV